MNDTRWTPGATIPDGYAKAMKGDGKFYIVKVRPIAEAIRAAADASPWRAVQQ